MPKSRSTRRRSSSSKGRGRRASRSASSSSRRPRRAASRRRSARNGPIIMARMLRSFVSQPGAVLEHFAPGIGARTRRARARMRPFTGLSDCEGASLIGDCSTETEPGVPCSRYKVRGRGGAEYLCRRKGTGCAKKGMHGRSIRCWGAFDG